MTTSILNQPRANGSDRSAGFKFLIMMLAAFMLSIPILSIYLLNYDRQSRSQEARASIASGWGGAQSIAVPQLIIPYLTRKGVADLVVNASSASAQTALQPERRQYSIYEAVVYDASLTGGARFNLPDDLVASGIPVAALQLDKARLQFGVSDVRGLKGGSVKATWADRPLKLLPGGEQNFQGFYAKVDARGLLTSPVNTSYAYGFRGNGTLSLQPGGDETSWTVTSPWPSPSFKGFLPTSRSVSDKGFTATWKLGGLALGGAPAEVPADDGRYEDSAGSDSGEMAARVDLFEPVDIYNQVDRATKYGFLFIGFTFVAFLMFDVIGGVRVSLVEYLLVGAGLVMFFVLLLAMAEVTGFGFAYAAASAAIIGLITAYSAAVLKSWGRAKWIGAMLSSLYAVLYVLLSLEAYSLLIGALLLFVALAGVMYLTRNVDWGAKKLGEVATP